MGEAQLSNLEMLYEVVCLDHDEKLVWIEHVLDTDSHQAQKLLYGLAFCEKLGVLGKSFNSFIQAIVMHQHLIGLKLVAERCIDRRTAKIPSL